MKKKGFTLIELLAVIIILAIIALIATPIVMNVIKNAKKGAAERSADNYINTVETAAVTEKLEGTPMTDGIYLIDEDGNLCKEGIDCQTNTDELIKIEMSGDKPSRGEIIIENGKVIAKNSDETKETTMFIGDYIVKYDEDNVLVATLISNSDNTNKKACTITKQDSTKYSLGDVVTCGNEKFYVLSSDSESVKTLTKLGLKLDETNPIQVENAGTLSYTTMENINSDYEHSLLYPYIIAYKNYLLNNVKISSVEVDLPEISDLGCPAGDIDNWGEGGCTSTYGGTAEPWVYSIDYWTKTDVGIAGMIYIISTNGEYRNNSCGPSYDCKSSIRPIVTIPISDIE